MLLLYSWNDGQNSLPSSEFFAVLSKLLIQRNYDKFGYQDRNVYTVIATPSASVEVHLTPTTERKPNSKLQLLQRQCKVCQRRTTVLCSLCHDENVIIHFCGVRKKRDFFKMHVDRHHFGIVSAFDSLRGTSESGEEDEHVLSNDVYEWDPEKLI